MRIPLGDLIGMPQPNHENQQYPPSLSSADDRGAPGLSGQSLVRLYRGYARTVSPFAYLVRSLIRRTANMGITAANCLDIGAGTAAYAWDIERHLQTTTYIALDIAPSDRCNLVGDACALPVADATMNLVVCFEVIGHVADPARVLQEIARTLKPGGILLMTFPFLYGECDFRDYHRWTLEGMCADVRSCGFKIVQANPRGGPMFALVCAVNWALQHTIPGQRRSWRAGRSASHMLRTAMTLVLTAPTTLLLWLALGIDRLLPMRGFYMGGSIIARKPEGDGLD